MKVATGLAVGSRPVPDLAREAVQQAMQAAGLSLANSVLLFLSAEFARDPLPGLRAAAKAASCTQVMGCSAPGLFTEQDWVLDVPAAAAMVFGDGVALVQRPDPAPKDLLLALAAPNAINITWLAAPGTRFGGVSGDATGQGPFSVWHHGQGAAEGHCEAILTGVHGVVGAAHGVRLLTNPAPVTAVRGHDLLYLAGRPALDTLRAAFPESDELPLHRLMLGVAYSAEAVKHGDYRLVALVGADEAERSVTLATRLEAGVLVFWALREADAAQQDLDMTLTQLRARLGGVPAFGLLFSCLGRGPYFYSGVDRDLTLLKKRLPGMPLIGLYGNGEIAPLHGVNELLQYSAVLALFRPDVQS